MCDYILLLEIAPLRKYGNHNTRELVSPSEHVYISYVLWIICVTFYTITLISVTFMLAVSDIRHYLWSIKINSKYLIHLDYWDISYGFKQCEDRQEYIVTVYIKKTPWL
jgi:hypothetical protein